MDKIRTKSNGGFECMSKPFLCPLIYQSLLYLKTGLQYGIF